MDDLRLVGVGASAGGIDALFDLVAGLEPDLNAALLVVIHQSDRGPAVLADLLAGRTPLAVSTARHGAGLAAGQVLVAPPDTHVHVIDGRVSLDHGPKENGHRPGIDPLFRSLALTAGPRATGVILSGMLDDGAAGLLDIVRHGGTAVVQEPGDAQFDAMPNAALDHVPGAVVRPATEIAGVLEQILARTPLEAHHPSSRLAYEVRVSRGAEPDTDTEPRDPPGAAAGLSCPDCSGPLFDLGTADHPRYRCRVGHGWSPHSLDAEQDDAVERALYAALRALEDKVALSKRIAESAQARGAERVAARSQQAARDALASARTLRRLVGGPGPHASRQEPPQGHDDSPS